MRLVRVLFVLIIAASSLTACGSTQPSYETAAWDSMSYGDTTKMGMDFSTMRPLAGSLR